MNTSAMKDGKREATLDTAALARLADEVIQQLQRGEKVDSAVLAQRYPDHAEKLRELLPAIQALADLSQSAEGIGPLGDDPLEDSAGKNRELGDFRILRQIGRGGMGIVYEAEQISLRRHVALKILPLAGVLDQRHLARFKNESLAAAALQHPNIVPVYAVGCERGIHYYAMQYVGGQNLAELIRELRIREGLDERQADADDKTSAIVQQWSAEQADADLTSKLADQKSAAQSTLIARKGSSTQRTRQEQTAYYRNIARLGLQAAEALAHAHEEGVIHRDIKPSNLLLDAHGKLWVTDFGLARTKTDAGVTLTGDLLGTLRYMSPEQAQAKRIPVDHRTDIYSLGATLYELLTLQPMFASDNQAELLRKITFDEPTPIHRLRADIPAELETIVLKSLEKNPRDRYDSARSLADDVQRYLDGVPILAHRPTVRQVAGRWCQRHQGAVTTVAIILLAGLSIGAASWWWIVRERFSRQQESLQAISSALAETKLQKTRAEKAAILEKAANEQAQKLLKQVEQANEILHSVMADLDIRKIKQGPEPLEAILAHRLVAAEKQLEQESVLEPLMMARLQDRLGRSLLSLGYPENATDLFQKASATAITLLGADNPATLDFRNDLARGYHDAGHFKKAIPIWEETLRIQKATLGADHEDTLGTMNNLARGYHSAGNLEKAQPLFEDTPRLTKAKLGENHRVTLISMNNLAFWYHSKQQLNRALPIWEETLRIQSAMNGADHPDTLQTANNLAIGYRDMGQHDKALPMFETTLRLSKTKLGINHPSTLLYLNNLAEGYKVTGHFDKALPLHEEALRLTRTRQGSDHPDTLRCMINLASGYKLARQVDKALPLYNEALQLAQSKLGANHPTTLIVMNNLAVAYEATGKLDLALPLYEETLKLRKAQLGLEHPDTLRSMDILANGYWAAGKRDLALPLYEQTLQLAQSKLEANHPTKLRVMNNLAAAYQATGKLDLAMPLYEETFKLTKAQLGPDHPVTLTSMSNLVQAYHDAGKFDRALSLTEAMFELLKAKFGPEDPSTLAILTNLAITYQQSGDLDKALPLFEQAASGMEKIKSQDLNAERAIFGTIVAYETAKQFDRAESWRRKRLALVKEKNGSASPAYGEELAPLGLNLINQQKWTEAEVILRECLAIREKSKPNDWRTFSTMSLLGGSHLGQKKYTEAVPLLLAGYQGMKEREKTIPPEGTARIPEALDRLIKLYTEIDKPEEVQKWQAERAKFPPAAAAPPPKKKVDP